MNVEEIFAQRLKELREEKGILQRQLADKTGLTQRKISKLETLQLTPSPSIIAAMADFFNVTTDYLLGRED